MKHLLSKIVVLCVAALSLASCDKYILNVRLGSDGNSIILDLSSESLPLSRATATGVEVEVSHLDVLIFEQNGTRKWHERVDGSTTGKGTITLKVKRSDFTENVGYWVYLIANSTADESVFSAENFDLTALRGLTQEDEMIHMTGVSNVTDAPQTFLMDGVAYLKSGGDNQPDGPVVLNNGTRTDDTELKVVLRRAAAKIVVRINKGDDVEFDDSPEAHNAGYYLRNMPYTTPVLTGVEGEAKLRTPDLNNSTYFNWTADVITVTAYAYAHEWDNESSLEKEVRLIVNIPMTYTPHDAEGTVTGDPRTQESSYYQIPVSKSRVLERNTCYQVNVTVNTPGAERPSEPVVLEPLTYEVRDWDEKTINIGGEQSRPAYLTVNESEMEMHNIPEDNTTLKFVSSSAVSVNIDLVYYYNASGAKVVFDAAAIAAAHITATPDEGLTGNIDIHSDVPTNNAIRYIVLTVTNEDGSTARTVTIFQYPLEYITNVVGSYSYRSDFGENGEDGKPTTYKQLNGQLATDGKVTSTSQISQLRVACYYNNNAWQYENRWRYAYSTSQQNNRSPYSFFGSKVAKKSTDGSYSIYYYHWDQSGNTGNYTYTVTSNETASTSSTVNVNGTNFYGDKTSLNNPRMYHVNITATSGTYTLGRPKMTDDGYTDSGSDNAELVSPSFMIASQLGSTTTADNITIAKEHCKQYVEVAENGTVYDDWRLPTRAEIGIINKFQYQSDAMAEVLTAKTYWCADGSEVTIVDENGKEQSSDNTKVTRCIRDAYDKSNN